MKLLATASLLALVSGCAADDGPDLTPPTIEIESPQRGAMIAGPTIEVTGRVTDGGSGIAEVRINDELVALDDGRVVVELAAPAGIAMIQTRATDAAGNASADVRAALVGDLAAQGSTIDAGVVGFIDGPTLEGMGGLISALASATDFGAIASALGPVVDTGGGCNSAKVYLDAVTATDVPVTTGPVAGGIAADVAVEGLAVAGHVTFRALCISGSAKFTLAADRYALGGTIRPSLVDGDLAIALDDVTSAFTGFSINVKGVPGFIEDLFDGAVRDAVAALLADELSTLVPELAATYLNGFLAGSTAFELLGQTVVLALAPSAMAWDEAGGRIALDASTTIDGLEGAAFLSTPMPAPTAAAQPGFSVGMADDVGNQLLALLWAAGAFDLELDLPPDSPARLFFPDAESLRISLALPPVVDAAPASGDLTVAVGDLILEAHDADQGLGLVTRLAASATIELAATTTRDGRVVLQTTGSRSAGQLLEQAADATDTVDELELTAMTDFAIDLISKKTDDVLGGLALPTVPGLELGALMSTAGDGYAIVNATLPTP